jgi:UDP-N-acetylmuramate: L-alanyl-gamma-D-glutamyl-meso-diaminopimelate ligase
MQHIHFIGVCGTAMATLAAMMKRRGHKVTGSDHDVYPPMSDLLAQERLDVFEGYDAAHVSESLDLVVVGNAISRGNVELESVLNRKIRYVSLPELVRDQFLWAARSIVIAGTHGKTTTASLVAWLLTYADRDPSMLVGGIAANFSSSYRLGGGRDFVIEGDEYDSAYFDKTAKFLKYLPDIAVVGTVEYDHADIYPDLAAVELAFRRFVNLIPERGLLLVGADDGGARRVGEHARCPVETFGLSEGATWRAMDVEVTAARTSFSVVRGAEAVGRFEMPLVGAHNVRNALAGIAIGRHLRIDAHTLAEGLRQFEGVRRRLELRGTVGGIRVYDDFAHHPTAIEETLRAVKAANPSGQLWAIFEPRSATSCLRIFQNEFVRSFAPADEVIIANVFRRNIDDDRRLSPEELVADLKRAGTHARFLPTTDLIVSTVANEARAGDLVVIMSNGGFDNVHTRLLQALGETRSAASS